MKLSEEAKDAEPILDLLRSHRFHFYLLVSGLLAVVGWGAYTFYLEYVYGLGLTGDRLPVAWGLNIVDFVFFIAISMAGTIISGALRLSNATWRKPITRIAETITIAALPIGALFPVTDLAHPERSGNLFAFARLQSPITWDTIAISTYFIGSLIYFYLPLIPDFAICRDSLKNISRLRRWLYSKLSLNWIGHPDQEKRLKSSIKIMAVLIVPIAVSVHSVLAWVFAVTLRVGMHSTVFPMYFVVGAVYSGMATILIVIVCFRKFYHLERYIEFKHILYLAYIFLAANLTMIYLTVTEYLTNSWTAETLDVQYFSSILTGTYAPYFWFMLVAGFLLPASIVAVPRTRTIGFIVLAAVLADMGMWVERYLIVIPSLAVPQLPYPTGVFAPSWEDISLSVAGVAGFVLLLIIVSRLVPMVSLWELGEKEGSQTILAPAIETSYSTSNSQSRVEGIAARRQFLKTGLLAAAGLGVGLALPRLALYAAGSLNAGKLSGQTTVQLSNLGSKVTLQEASRAANFEFSLPSKLPSGTELKEARIAADGGMIALLYRNDSLRPLNIYDERVDLAIFQVKDGMVTSPPSFLPQGFQRVTIQGSPGFSQDSQKNGGPGQLQWWSGGKRISMLANLPGSELQTIADSMEASVNA